MKMTDRTENSVLKQIADLHNLSHVELQQLWRTLHSKEPPAFNRPFLIKRLAFRIQELAYGGLSPNACEVMDEMLDGHGYDANGGDCGRSRIEQRRKEGLPIPGTRFVREWRGKMYEVTVTPDGFEYEGRRFRSLTAIAQLITGTNCNGRVFFGMNRKKKGRQ